MREDLGTDVFCSQPNEQCVNGPSVRDDGSLRVAFALCSLRLLQPGGGSVGGGADTAAMKRRKVGAGLWASLRKVRGPQGNKPQTP